MHLTKQSEIKTFWKLLNKLDFDQMKTRNSANDVTPSEWMKHYTNLLQGAAQGKIPDNTAESGPLDYEITVEEIMNAKGILKPGKATGIDIINNEMILEALIMYPEAFKNVMNILLKMGTGVTQWLTSLLRSPPQTSPRHFPTEPDRSEMSEIVGKVGNCRKCRKMSENVRNCRKMSETVGIVGNGWKRLELSENVGKCRKNVGKIPEIVGNCRKMSEFLELP